MSVIEPEVDHLLSVDLGLLDPEPLAARRTRWLVRYRRALVALDALVLAAAGLVAALARFGPGAPEQAVRGIGYLLGSLLLLPVWLGTLALSRCYEERFLGSGTEEFRRVANASSRVAGVVVALLFMTKTDVSRGFLMIALTLGLVGVVGGRYAARLWLHRQRRLGRCLHSVVVVGPAAEALEMTTRLQAAPLAGFQVVGACVAGDGVRYSVESQVPVLGNLTDVLPVLNRLGADGVVVAKGPGIGSEELRDLAYELEGTGIDLLVSPRILNITGPRISWRSIVGLPLLHVDEPELAGARRLVKEVFDRLLGLVLLLVATPLVLVLALAVRVTTAGPAFFLQERVGRSGRTFRMWKLRTMYADAEQRREALTTLNVHADGGILFKVLDDPRVTPLGRLLRRYSLDELPQLVNVVRGQMSLVGPRPPLPDEVARYQGDLHRRLLVKPGMTGLWQVSGRSDLAWEDSVRLDLHYVENWSLGLDVAIICKTVLAVLKPRGAY